MSANNYIMIDPASGSVSGYRTAEFVPADKAFKGSDAPDLDIMVANDPNLLPIEYPAGSRLFSIGEYLYLAISDIEDDAIRNEVIDDAISRCSDHDIPRPSRGTDVRYTICKADSNPHHVILRHLSSVSKYSNHRLTIINDVSLYIMHGKLSSPVLSAKSIVSDYIRTNDIDLRTPVLFSVPSIISL